MLSTIFVLMFIVLLFLIGLIFIFDGQQKKSKWMSELISNSYQIIKIINDNEHLFDGHAEVSEKIWLRPLL